MESRILFIWFKQYGEILDGGAKANFRCFHFLQTLFGKDHVDSFYIHDINEKNNCLTKIRTAFLFFADYHNGVTNRKIKQILKISHKYDYIFLSTSLFGIIAKQLKKNGYSGTIISHFHNVESMYYNASLPNIPGKRIIVNCAEHNDRYSCLYADKTIVLNDRDDDILERQYRKRADLILPISLPDRFTEQQNNQMTSSCPLCLFIGSSFKPNNDAVLWFVRNVLPHVNIRFKVVGKNMSELQKSHSCLKGIDIISNAPSLEPYFIEADFMVLPIFSGSGMKVKTCESLMYGKNIIGTDETFEGYELNTEKVGARCNTAQEYIDAINHFIHHPVPKHNRYSREIFVNNYSENASLRIFKTLFEPYQE